MKQPTTISNPLRMGRRPDNIDIPSTAMATVKREATSGPCKSAITQTLAASIVLTDDHPSTRPSNHFAIAVAKGPTIFEH